MHQTITPLKTTMTMTMTLSNDRYVEEEYFDALVLRLDNIGVKDPQATAHEIMDVWTVNGVLDVEGLDRAMCGVDNTTDDDV